MSGLHVTLVSDRFNWPEAQSSRPPCLQVDAGRPLLTGGIAAL